MILVRHTNGLIPAALCGTLVVRERSFRGCAWLTAIVAALCVAPQLLLYHAASGHWIISSYGTLGFTWSTPHIAGVLVSPQKGLFFWAPLLLIAVAGLAWLPEDLRPWRPAIIAILLVDTYVIASWFDWQFGASYGHRGFVDLYPLLAPGLAAAFARVSARPSLRAATAVVVVLLCALSVFQMLQYWHGVMPMSDVTWTQVQVRLPEDMVSRRVRWLVCWLVVVAAALAYLRDPPWLIDQASGLRGWEQPIGEPRYRWSGGHASFFVPRGCRHVRSPALDDVRREGQPADDGDGERGRCERGAAWC